MLEEKRMKTQIKMGSDTFAQFEKANEEYSGKFQDSGLPLPPSRKVAIVTCMDARIDPAKSLGIELGQCHIIRNAGGRTSEALRSLVISQQLLGTRDIVVIHHTDCGMLTFSNDMLNDHLKSHLQLTALPQIHDFLPFSNLEKSVEEDVVFLRTNELILKETKLRGYIYDVNSGKLHVVSS
ncbi:hypothetical protein K7432_012946 [Basidiobolus ranarum]|uniref:Carbonic anhydrase n=1 Tax=Basidiobolus ranarum TaxID=34480 RepID=A0ABR2VSE1_9FUNG